MDFAAERKRLLQQLLRQEIDEATYERLRARVDEAERAGGADPNQTVVGLLAPGFELDGYRLVESLGGGGMGEVWAARHEQAERDVALKILPEPFQKLPAELARFRATFHLVDKLHHPHICPLYELKHFAHPRVGWYQTMRLLRGRNLREYVEQGQFPGGRLPLELVVRMLRPVAQALDYAHGQEVVHRDVKLENLFLEGSGLDVAHVWLIDFGVAAEITATMTNALPQVETVGSRWYLAPEVWQAKRPKGPADQYSLACVAYELLDGALPFQSADQYILRQAVLNDAPEPLERVPFQVNAALLRALSKSPADRFASCLEFVEALAGAGPAPTPVVKPVAAKVVPAPVRSDPPVEPAAPPVQRQKPSWYRSFLNGLLGVVEDVEHAMHSTAAIKDVAPSNQPALLKAPFSQEAAMEAQRAWAEHLGRKVLEKNSLGMELALIPPGTFLMGSHRTEKERQANEGPVEVTLTRPFWLGRAPVTREQWTELMRTKPWDGEHCVTPGNNHPATYVSWEDAVEYCRVLTQREGGKWKYRLPTEAEWEWACRAGTITPFWFGVELNGNQANCDGDEPYGTNQEGPYKGATTAAGSYAANPYGLWDMHGNVWEWCADWLQEQLPGGENPEVTFGGLGPATRGGGWLDNPVDCRAACRTFGLPGTRGNDLGFRVLAVPFDR